LGAAQKPLAFLRGFMPEPETIAKTAIRVINLAHAIERREEFTQLARPASVDWHFFPACTGPTARLRYDERAAIRRCGRRLSNGEVGCYASHFMLWDWLAASDYEQAIIFEDDVIVDWAVIEQLTLNRFADYGIDLLRLYLTHPFPWNIAKYRLLSPNSHLVRPRGMTFGTQGYLLTRDAARILVSRYGVAAAPVDWVLGRYWEHGLATFSIHPFPVIERHSSSGIGDRRHTASQRKARYDGIAYIAWRIRDRFQRAFVENCVLKKYPLGKTEDSGPPFLQRKPLPADRV
jgi:glycosyl transferase, family 25